MKYYIMAIGKLCFNFLFLILGIFLFLDVVGLIGYGYLNLIKATRDPGLTTEIAFLPTARTFDINILYGFQAILGVAMVFLIICGLYLVVTQEVKEMKACALKKDSLNEVSG